MDFMVSLFNNETPSPQAFPSFFFLIRPCFFIPRFFPLRRHHFLLRNVFPPKTSLLSLRISFVVRFSLMIHVLSHALRLWSLYASFAGVFSHFLLSLSFFYGVSVPIQFQHPGFLRSVSSLYFCLTLFTPVVILRPPF